MQKHERTIEDLMAKNAVSRERQERGEIRHFQRGAAFFYSIPGVPVGDRKEGYITEIDDLSGMPVDGTSKTFPKESVRLRAGLNGRKRDGSFSFTHEKDIKEVKKRCGVKNTTDLMGMRVRLYYDILGNLGGIELMPEV
ncbi:hypothetical protein HY439_00345 [Candidatus Microgenomates bacterium]|nr:hypothetical protein [Candidatus Microgenomates bacterium]